jgi:hypothetical protein
MTNISNLYTNLGVYFKFCFIMAEMDNSDADLGGYIIYFS